ncbi:TRAP transporter substrate-binding protein, partial [Chloroflexota bacterium]
FRSNFVKESEEQVMLRKKILYVLSSILIITCLVFSLVITSCATTEEFEGVTWIASDTPYSKVPAWDYWLGDMANDLSVATDGKVTVEFREGLYGSSERLGPVNENVIQLTLLHEVNYSTTISEWNLTMLPFILNEHKEFIDFIDGGGKQLYVDDVLERYGYTNLETFFTVSSGEQWIRTSTPLRTVNDFDGVKLRTWPALQGIIEDFGGIYTMIPWEELSLALDRGVIDALTAPDGSALSYEFYQWVPYQSMLPLVVSFPATLVINKNALNELPSDLRQTVIDFFNDVGKKINDELEWTGRAALEQELRAVGVEFIEPDPALLAQAQSLAKPYIEAWANEKPEHMALITKMEEVLGRDIL